MTHRFSVRHVLGNGRLSDIQPLLATPEFHLAVCRKVPSENLRIVSSTMDGDRYTLAREHNLDVNIPELAKRFLQGAFKLWRDDEWSLGTLSCRSRFRMNMPAEFRCTTRLKESSHGLEVHHEWEVDVRVPLIHGVLARHAESEIRRFNAIELEVMRAEVALHIAGRRSP